MELGRVGIWSMQLGRMPATAVREAVTGIEALGFRAIWYPETLAKEAMSQAALLLAAGREAVVASGIANIWARDPVAMANGARTLAEAYPGRFVLGIGDSVCVEDEQVVGLQGHDRLTIIGPRNQTYRQA